MLRVQVDDAAIVHRGQTMAASLRQYVGQTNVGVEILGIAPDRLAKMPLGLVIRPALRQQHTEVAVRPGKVGLQPQGFPVLLDCGVGLAHQSQGRSQVQAGRRAVRIRFYRLLQFAEC